MDINEVNKALEENLMDGLVEVADEADGTPENNHNSVYLGDHIAELEKEAL